VAAHQADGLTALGDPTRRAVFELLADGPRAVGELASELPVTRPAVSQHLKVLKEAGLVIDRPDGTRRLYELNPDGIVTQGDAAPIKGLATPAGAGVDDPPNRVPVSAEITREGGLLVMVDDAVPVGTRINIVLEYGNLFLSWPEGSPCPDGGVGCLGYGIRFFVGEEPATEGNTEG